MGLEEKAHLWELVKELEIKATDIEREHASAKATMLVNFGPDAHKGSPYPNLITGKETLGNMLMKVFEHMHEIIKKSNNYC